MSREKISFDKGWKFHLGDIESIRNRWGWAKSGSWNEGPESIDFDDGEWEDIELPHDFVIGTKPHSCLESKTDKAETVPFLENLNDKHIPAGFYERAKGWYHTMYGSFLKETGWYRRHFFIPKEYKGQKLYLVFEGIFRDSTIWLNEFFIGKERSGYKQIVIDITDFVQFGADNLLSVKADAREAEGWFYEGGGIYRHVYLLKTAREHIDNVFIHCNVDLTEEKAEVCAGITFDEAWEALTGTTVKTILYDDKGLEIAAKEENLKGMEKLTQTFLLKKPKLWDTENPYLYRAVTLLFVNGEEKDSVTTRFGIRHICFEAERGFLLNGMPVKIKGVCCHQNHGGLGTALPDEIYRFRIRKLKEMGVNSYRTAHYPPAPGLLDICDEEGILVMDETRLLSSERGDLEQLDAMVKRDRNHPSVILYSLGNEEVQSQTMEQGARMAETMIRHIKKLDPYTPVTMALIMSDLKKRRPITDVGEIAGISEQLDVAGFNYWSGMWPVYHETYPAQPMVCTEQGAFRATRGCYDSDTEKCHLAVTDKTFNGYMAAVEQWKACRPDWMSGIYIWTGFDYYGEPKPYGWPAISSQPGALDLCGYPKDSFYYYQSWWSDKKVLHIFPHWTWKENSIRDLYVFSNCEEVELFVNDVSIGRKTMKRDEYLIWNDVAFVPGKLTGVGYCRDTETGEFTETMRRTIKTAGAAYAIKLTEDFRENDICVIRAEIVDREGNVVPDGEDEIVFEVKGGKILGTSNGDPSDHMAPNGNVRRAFHGLAQAVIQLDTAHLKQGEIWGEAAAEICAMAENVRGCTLKLQQTG